MTTSPPDLSSLRIRREPDESRPSRGSRRALIIGLLVGVLAVVAALAVFFARSRPLEVNVAVASAVGGGTVSAEGISANGYVVARTKASVSAKIPGRLEYLGVDEGSRVRRGEVIARIEAQDYLAALKAARATLEENEARRDQSKRDFERAQSLLRQGLIAQAEFDDVATRLRTVEAQASVARAQVELAEVYHENTRVRAPFDGTVLRKDAEVGEIVAPASAGGGLTRTAIVTMADLGTLEVEVDVNEAYISQVRDEHPARITLDAYPDTSFTGRVRQVVPTADRQKATVLVKVSILDRDPHILPEMGAKVVFVGGSGQVAGAAAPRRVLVPAAAVVRGETGARVWVVEDGRAVARAVEAGPERSGQIEVRRGLSGGETVVIDPPASLRDGLKVRAAGS